MQNVTAFCEMMRRISSPMGAATTILIRLTSRFDTSVRQCIFLRMRRFGNTRLARMSSGHYCVIRDLGLVKGGKGLRHHEVVLDLHVIELHAILLVSSRPPIALSGSGGSYLSGPHVAGGGLGAHAAEAEERGDGEVADALDHRVAARAM